MDTRESRLGVFAALAFAAAILIIASPATAETDAGSTVVNGEVEVGGRTITGDWGSSKFEEYRDLRPGLFGGGEVSVEGKEGMYYFDASANNVYRDDQHYEARSGRYGRYRLEVEYDEMPHVFSNAARTLYTEEGDGILTLPDSTQATIQNGSTSAEQSAALQNALAGVRRVPLRFLLKSGRVGFYYRPLVNLEFNVGYRIQQKDGTRPWGMAFGSPGGNFVNVAAPIDERIHEVKAGVQYTVQKNVFRLDYTGSLYENDINTLTVDNPLRATDSSSSGSSRGRTDMAPDNSAHVIALTGTAPLPLAFPARAAATVSYGIRRQDDPFVPYTINSAISTASLPLPAKSLDGQVNTILGSFRLMGRPVRDLNLTTQYRYYDYSSDFNVLTFPGHVVTDRTLETEILFTTPVEFSKHNATVDASYRLAPPTTLKAGYEWERWDRDASREVSRTDEHIAKAGVDYNLAAWAVLRTTYRFGIRDGSPYNTFASLERSSDPEEVDAAKPTYQSPLLRKYDEANRTLHRGDVITEIKPVEDVSIGLSGSYSRSDYGDTKLGLNDSDQWSAGVDTGVQVATGLAVSTFYTYENVLWSQRSRWRPVSGTTVGDDPLNNWESDSEDRVHTAGVTTDFVLIPDRLDGSISYVVAIARGETRASGVPGFTNATGSATPPDGGNAVDYPDLKDTLHSPIVVLRYHLQKHFTVKLQYRYENFRLVNFKTDNLEPFMASSNVNGSGTVSPSTDVFLGNRVDDYAAHIISLSGVYRF